MKDRLLNIKTMSLGLFLIFIAVGFSSCDRESSAKYDMTDGLPEVFYIRMTDPAAADSLIVGAFMEQTVCLVGNNLTSIQEIYFNDQKALLNPNFITENTLMVTVPKTIPNDVTNKMYMVTGAKDTVPYDFKVGIPAPILGRVVCEHVPEGKEVIVTGDYFFDYDNDPIVIRIGGYTIPHSDIVSVTKTRVVFLAPPASVKGSISIGTPYGNNTPSYKDLFRDMSGLITSFEDSENGGAGFAGGWGRPDASALQEDPQYVLTGKYLRWEGALTVGEWSSGGNHILNIWSQANSDINDPMFTTPIEKSALKFEINVLTEWSALPIVLMFDAANTNENYLWADATQPRAFYAPWTSTGKYVSEGWETVTIPLTDMKYNGSGAEVGLPTAFGELGISMHNRGGAEYAGTADCSPTILIDNIRVVSME